MSSKTKQRFEVLISLILIMLFAMSSTAAEEAQNAPVMVIPETVFDFKEVKEGAILEHTFKVYNKGGSILTIKRVKPG